MQGQTVLLTGATEGIGKAAAFELVKAGCNLTIVARNAAKGEALLEQLKQVGASGSLALERADLSSMTEVRALADRFKAGHSRLDVLINNAGAIFTERQTSADGLEMTFALNHMGYFLLTQELLPLIRATEGARVVSTASGAHMAGKLDLATVAQRPNMVGGAGVGFQVYSDSKLCNVLFTRELATRLNPGQAAVCFHPGFVRTGFGDSSQGLMKRIVQWGALFARTPEKGAETLVYLAKSPAANLQNGGYYFDRAIARTSRLANDVNLAKQLWALSEQVGASRVLNPA